MTRARIATVVLALGAALAGTAGCNARCNDDRGDCIGKPTVCGQCSTPVNNPAYRPNRPAYRPAPARPAPPRIAPRR